MQPIAIVDLDETLADYNKGIQEYAKIIGLDKEEDLRSFHDNENRAVAAIRNMFWSIPNWWCNLDVIPTNETLFYFLKQQDFRLVILSKAPKYCLNAWSEKIDWCNNYFLCAEVLLTDSKKDLVYGDIFIDDNKKNMDSWLNRWSNGFGILPITPYNSGYSHPRAIYFDGSLDSYKKVSDIVVEVKERCQKQTAT